MNDKKLKVIIFVLFVVMNFVVYFLTNSNVQQRIDSALREELKGLKTHYEILLYHQKITADAAYESTLIFPGFLELFEKIPSATKEQRNDIRKRLATLLEKTYTILQKKGVLQYHFVLPNSHSFLRLHKIDKFGDNLTGIRTDFDYVNK